jgi:DNA-binding transcriptional MerR regulator
MSETFSIEALAEQVNAWCLEHRVEPVSGQAGERLSERNVRYYRTLGLIDAPVSGGGSGYGEKHLLQLKALRLLQAQGLPLNRIRDLLFGRTLDELREVERRGLAELGEVCLPSFRPVADESWTMTPIDDEFLLISRRGRGISGELRAKLQAVLNPETKSARLRAAAKNKE